MQSFQCSPRERLVLHQTLDLQRRRGNVLDASAMQAHGILDGEIGDALSKQLLAKGIVHLGAMEGGLPQQPPHW